MTKAEFIKELKENAGLPSIAVAEAAFESLFDIIKKELASGEKVAISGFGTFSVAERAARKGRNPQTGEEINIAASKGVKFSAGKGLKDKLK